MLPSGRLGAFGTFGDAGSRLGARNGLACCDVGFGLMTGPRRAATDQGIAIGVSSTADGGSSVGGRAAAGDVGSAEGGMLLSGADERLVGRSCRSLPGD